MYLNMNRLKLLLLFLTTNIICLAQSPNWQKLCIPPSNQHLTEVVLGDSGFLYVSGIFINHENKSNVYRYKDCIWSQVGVGENGLNANERCFLISNDSKQNIYVSGYFTDSLNWFDGFSYIAKWDGIKWSKLNTFSDSLIRRRNDIDKIVIDTSGNIYVSGNIKNIYGFDCVITWKGNKWVEVGTDSNALNAYGHISSICVDKQGNLYAAGSLKGNTGDYFIAKWDGLKWTKLPKINYSSGGSIIHAISVDLNNNLYAAGNFKNANYKHYVAKWDGKIWSELSTLITDSAIREISSDPYSNIYVTAFTIASNGYTYIAKFDGKKWIDFGGHQEITYGAFGGHIYSDPNGNLYWGHNDTAGGYLMYLKNPVPMKPSSNLKFSEEDSTSFKIDFTKGEGKKRLVVCGTAPIYNFPEDDVHYSGIALFKSGSKLDSNSWVVYNDTGTSVIISGLQKCTPYFISIFEYNADSNHIYYLRNFYLTGTDTTRYVNDLTINSTRSDTNFCEGQQFTLFTTKTGNGTYQWYRNNSILVNQNNSAISNLNDSGSYTLKVTNNNCYTFSNTFILQLKQSPKSKFTINSTYQCFTDNYFIFIDSSIIPKGIFSRQWDFGEINNDTSSSPVANKSYKNPGEYQVKLVVTSVNGCKDSVEMPVFPSIRPKVGLWPNNTSQCLQNNSFLLRDTTSWLGPINRKWIFNENQIDTASEQTINVKFDSEGTYKVKLIIMAANCTDSEFVLLKVNPMPNTSLRYNTNGTTFCEGKNIRIAADTGYKYQWLYKSQIIGGANDSFFLAHLNGAYQVILTDKNGCKDTSANVVLTLLQLPEIGNIIGKQVALLNDTATYSVKNEPSVSYEWEIFGGIIKTGQGSSSVLLKWISNGINRIVVHAINASQCLDSSNLNVIVSYNSIQESNPNNIILSPNPIHDILYVQDTHNAIEGTAMEISDLLGRFVFSFILKEGLNQVDLSNLIPGAYFIMINQAQNRFYRKIVKY